MTNKEQKTGIRPDLVTRLDVTGFESRQSPESLVACKSVQTDYGVHLASNG
jgi:hypothetical protein